MYLQDIQVSWHRVVLGFLECIPCSQKPQNVQSMFVPILEFTFMKLYSAQPPHFKLFYIEINLTTLFQLLAIIDSYGFQTLHAFCMKLLKKSFIREDSFPDILCDSWSSCTNCCCSTLAVVCLGWLWKTEFKSLNQVHTKQNWTWKLWHFAKNQRRVAFSTSSLFLALSFSISQGLLELKYIVVNGSRGLPGCCHCCQGDQRGW